MTVYAVTGPPGSTLFDKWSNAGGAPSSFDLAARLGVDFAPRGAGAFDGTSHWFLGQLNGEPPFVLLNANASLNAVIATYDIEATIDAAHPGVAELIRGATNHGWALTLQADASNVYMFASYLDSGSTDWRFRFDHSGALVASSSGGPNFGYFTDRNYDDTSLHPTSPGAFAVLIANMGGTHTGYHETDDATAATATTADGGVGLHTAFDVAQQIDAGASEDAYLLGVLYVGDLDLILTGTYNTGTVSFLARVTLVPQSGPDTGFCTATVVWSAFPASGTFYGLTRHPSDPTTFWVSRDDGHADLWTVDGALALTIATPDTCYQLWGDDTAVAVRNWVAVYG